MIMLGGTPFCKGFGFYFVQGKDMILLTSAGGKTGRVMISTFAAAGERVRAVMRRDDADADLKALCPDDWTDSTMTWHPPFSPTATTALVLEAMAKAIVALRNARWPRRRRGCAVCPPAQST